MHSGLHEQSPAATVRSHLCYSTAFLFYSLQMTPAILLIAQLLLLVFHQKLDSIFTNPKHTLPKTSLPFPHYNYYIYSVLLAGGQEKLTRKPSWRCQTSAT